MFQVYSISFNGEIIYIGSTGHGKHRWTCHKTKARNMNNHARPLHKFMNSNTSDLKTFPEYKFNIICVTEDEDTAKELEEMLQEKHNLKPYNKEIRPSQQSNYETR